LEHSATDGDSPLFNVLIVLKYFVKRWYMRENEICFSLFDESSCLRVQLKIGVKFHLKLKYGRKTDSEKVLWRKDEKNFEKRVKLVPEIVKNKEAIKTSRF